MPKPILAFTTKTFSAKAASIERYGTDYSTNPSDTVIKLTLTADMANVTDTNILSITGAELDLNIDWTQFEAFTYQDGSSQDFEFINAITTPSIWQTYTDEATGVLNKLVVGSIDIAATPSKTLVDDVESSGMGIVDRPSVLELGSIYLKPVLGLESVDFSYEGLIVINEASGNINQASTSMSIDTALGNLQGTAGIDNITTLEGADVVYALAGNDTINLSADSVWSSSYAAQNVSNTNSVGTNQKIALTGLNRFSDVIDGGADVDTLNLTTGNDAFFIDDIYSDHHSSLTLTSTTQGIDSTARITNLEVINAGDGNDIVDLTSTNYILANAVVINGEAGNDNLWGSNGNDTIDGGTGDDSIFGGTGSDTLTGGTGNDVFQFTATAGSDVISDFGVGSDSISLYHRATDKHTNADLDLTNGILTWDVDTTNNDVVIDLSATTTSSDLNSLDALITFVEIV